jgi:hypothetical protein
VSITRVDFKTLDRLGIKPLGVYGSKDEIVRLLRSIGAVDENGRVIPVFSTFWFSNLAFRARSLLNPTNINGSQLGLSSGLYIVRANAATVDPLDERHYLIYWPEDTTWNDSAASSVRRNRVTFMRSATFNCSLCSLC